MELGRSTSIFGCELRSQRGWKREVITAFSLTIDHEAVPV
jgi:hypothetical protein